MVCHVIARPAEMFNGKPPIKEIDIRYYLFCDMDVLDVNKLNSFNFSL
jgi:hypothetical protein